MKILAIGGCPGTGKTSLMRAWMAQYTNWDRCYEDFKLVPYMKWTTMKQNENGRIIYPKSIYVLGKYDGDEIFAGTDRMSMAVQPQAIKFLDSLPSESTVIFEGDRLFTPSFLEDCLNLAEEFLILHISADQQTLNERYKERGSEQDETWLKGRESKVRGILRNMELMPFIESWKNITLDDQKRVVDRINSFIGV